MLIVVALTGVIISAIGSGGLSVGAIGVTIILLILTLLHAIASVENTCAKLFEVVVFVFDLISLLQST